MNENELYALLIETLREALPGTGPVIREMELTDLEGYDSMGRIGALLAVERAFGILLAAEEVARLRTLGDLAALIQKAKQDFA